MSGSKTSIDHFVFMRSYLDAVKDLDEKDQAAALLAIVRYALDGKEPTGKGVVKALFRGFRYMLDKSRAKMKAGNTPKRTKQNGSKTEANAKQNGSKAEANQYEENRREEKRIEEEVTSKEEEKEKVKKEKEEESPQPSSHPESSIKEDLEAIQLLRDLTKAERNPGAPPLILPTDVRERYARILQLRKDDNQSYYTDVPCAGGFCKANVQVSVEDLQEALKTKKLPNDTFFCQHCKEHGGTGRLFENWLKACPKRFQEEIDVARFPQDAWERIKGWGKALPKGRMSLYIYGKVGTGKSRMAYFALFNYVSRRKLRFDVLTWASLQDALRKNSVEELCAKLVGMDVVLLDDFSASKLSDRATTKLQNVVENHLLSGKRIIFIASVPPEDLEMCHEKTPTVERLIARIKTDCTLVET